MPGPSSEDIERFEREGYLHLRGAFDRETAADGATWLYEQITTEHPAFDPEDLTTAPGPKFLYPGSIAPPFMAAAASPIVATACDALVGVGRWTPRVGLGAFPIRFPHPDDANDDGWHIDASIPTGNAGDVYLCHPFLVHAAGSHPARPRIIAQPDIAHDAGVGTWRADGDYSPVERAIRAGIDTAGLAIPDIEPQARVG